MNNKYVEEVVLHAIENDYEVRFNETTGNFEFDGNDEKICIYEDDLSLQDKQIIIEKFF